MNSRHLIAAAALLTAASLALGGCLVTTRPGYYGTYGYSVAAAPNTVYYSGGYYNNTYYRPGYYYRTAPFVSSTTYVAPSNTYVAPSTTYVAPSGGAYVSGGASVVAPGVGVSTGVVVR